eukprot:scaffold870_cov268-Pinguiococcus_pyrenoidosus.AAC.90
MRCACPATSLPRPYRIQVRQERRRKEDAVFGGKCARLCHPAHARNAARIVGEARTPAEGP